MALSEFQQAVLDAIRRIPPGKVCSYGQIAAAIGAPRAARQVGGAMRSMETHGEFPWWRVLNAQGRITIKGNVYTHADLQRDLLRAEGVAVDEFMQVNMGQYQYNNLALLRGSGTITTGTS